MNRHESDEADLAKARRARNLLLGLMLALITLPWLVFLRYR
jgi:hypothetical protein